MRLPERIPERLRKKALSLPGFGDGEGAWSASDAVAVLESLKGTTVYVAGVVLFQRVQWGYAESKLALALERLPSEGDMDYALRSRSSAVNFIRRHELDGEEWLVALTFPMWKDAA
jgi:hypothetical protein